MFPYVQLTTGGWLVGEGKGVGLFGSFKVAIFTLYILIKSSIWLSLYTMDRTFL